MNNVQIKREALLEVLKANRKQHRETFDKAITGFEAQAIETLNNALKAARKGVRQSVRVHLEMPNDQTKDYDRKIQMFEMDVRDVLELTESEFACYVMDDWQWKDQFTRTTSQYLQ